MYPFKLPDALVAKLPKHSADGYCYVDVKVRGHLLLGSVAERIVRLAPCPVLSMHPKLECTQNKATPK